MPKYLLIIIGLSLTACSNIHFPGVYKIAIEQGNIVEQDMIDQLKPGMSKTQVEYILGTPLIRDTFNGDRWDYLYSMQKGDGPREQKRLTVFFKDDELDHFTGDYSASPESSDDAGNNNADNKEQSPKDQGQT